MIAASVPTLSSVWSGTGTVRVDPSDRSCMTTWLAPTASSLDEAVIGEDSADLAA